MRRFALKSGLQAVVLATGLMHLPFADAAENRITQVDADTEGNIILTVEGEGFDPLLQLEAAGNGTYRIVIQASDVNVDDTLRQNMAALNRRVEEKIPAITAVNFFTDKTQSGTGIRLVLESARKLQPHVRGNTGSQIVISLIGDRSRPALAASPAVEKKAVAASPAREKPTGKKAPSSSQWQPGYRNVTVEALDLEQPAQPAARPAELIPPTTPRKPAEPVTSISENITPVAPAQEPAHVEEPEVSVPVSPLKLKATPPNFQPHEPEMPPAGTPAGSTLQPSWIAYATGDQSPLSVRQAWQEMMSGNAIAAQTMLQAYLQGAGRNDAMARYLYARMLLADTADQSQRESARHELLTIVSQAPHLPAYLLLMDLYLEDGNYEDAGRLWEKVAPKYPREATVLYRKGRLHEALNELDAARETYMRALSIQPDNGYFYYRLAQAELKSGRLEAAQWTINQGLVIAPDDARLWKLNGYLADKRNNLPQSAKAYRHALQPDALINYGRVLEKQKQREKALSVYRAAEALGQDDPDILFNLGMLYAGMHEDVRARETLQRFVTLRKDASDSRVAKAKGVLKQISVPKKQATSG